MFDFDTFEATVYNAIVDDPKSEAGKRDAQYIPARDIPAEILSMIGYELSNKRHPHHIPGMAWDFIAGNWRNMKNAQVIDCMPGCAIIWDKSDSRTFILC